MPTQKNWLRRYVTATARNPALLSARKEYNLILSHMRARTSVLSHILGSHPEITGHSEMHQGYSNSLDLLKLRLKVSLDNSNTLQGRYVLDKLVNDYPFSTRIITAPTSHLIFLLRRPEPTVKSIMAMAEKYGGVDWHRDARMVLEYYTTRLAQLVDIARVRHAAGATPAFFFESRMLLEHTTAVLHELSDWLGLATELSSHYNVFETTGQLGWGDPSDAIRSSQVLKSTNQHEVEVPAEILEQAAAAYDACRVQLQALCRSPAVGT